jgi:hypothetical protein
MFDSNTYILVVAVKGMKNAANNVTDRTISAVQGAGRQSKKAAEKVEKEATGFFAKIRKSLGDLT